MLALRFRWPAPVSIAPIGQGAEAGEAQEQHRPGRWLRHGGPDEVDLHFAVAALHSVEADQIGECGVQGAAAATRRREAPGVKLRRQP